MVIERIKSMPEEGKVKDKLRDRKRIKVSGCENVKSMSSYFLWDLASPL